MSWFSRPKGPPSELIPDTPYYDAQQHLAHVRKLYKTYPLNTYDACSKDMDQLIDAVADDVVLPESIRQAMRYAMQSIMVLDKYYHFEEPTRVEPDYLREVSNIFINPELIDKAREAIAYVFAGLVQRLKPYLIKAPPGSPMVAITDIVNAADYVGAAMYEIGTSGALPTTTLLMTINAARASGLDPGNYDHRKIKKPGDIDLPSSDLADAFLRGTHLQNLLDLTVPFTIKHWNRHGIAIAPTGFGKSQLIQSFIKARLTESDPVGFFFLDPHGDSFEAVASRVDPSRLVVIDPDDPKRRPSLNFLDFRGSTEIDARQTFEYLMSSLSGGLSDKQGAIVPYLLKLLRKIPNASLETLRLLVDEKVKSAGSSTFAAHIAELPTVDQGFFHNQFYHSSMEPTKQAIGWKIYAAMASDAFREMFASSGGSSIDFSELIEQRKVVIVKGGRNSLGDEGMRIFLQFILAQYFSAGVKRQLIPANQRHLNLMFVDEATFVLSSPIIAKFCFELRKYMCGLWLATQVYEQIGLEVRAAILGSVGTKIVGPVSFSDANVLGREMNVGAEMLRSLRAVDRSHAEWAMYENTITPHAVRVIVPYGVLEGMPKIKTNLASRLSPPKTHEGPSKPLPPVAEGTFNHPSSIPTQTLADAFALLGVKPPVVTAEHLKLTGIERIDAISGKGGQPPIPETPVYWSDGIKSQRPANNPAPTAAPPASQPPMPQSPDNHGKPGKGRPI